MAEFAERPIASQDSARGGPDQNNVLFRRNKADTQPLANDPIMLPKR